MGQGRAGLFILVLTACTLLAATLLVGLTGDEARSPPRVEGPDPAGPGSSGTVFEPPPLEPLPPRVPPWIEDRPNFLVIFVDDQNDGTMPFMPRTNARIFGEGVTFTNGYVTTPVCCPSRVSLLTGQHANRHGTLTNFDPIRAPEVLPAHLQAEGYFTAHVGKYLNTWDGSPRPEYDHWMAHAGAQSDYFDPRLNLNGRWAVHRGYITDIFAESVLEAIDTANARGQDFAVFWWPNAPHGPAQPATEDLFLYNALAPYRPPSLNEEDTSDKPRWLEQLSPVTAARTEDMDSLRLRQLRTLASLDRAVDRVLDRLDELDLAENTVVFYLSDNGILTGEHKLIDKHYAYQETVKVPFGMRYPAWVTRPLAEDRLVANVDVPATIYEIAGIHPPQVVDGRSLVPLLSGAGPWREHLYLEAWPKISPPWQAIHDGVFVYIETHGDRAELYDLVRDPFQLESVAGDPAYGSIEALLKGVLEQERAPWLLEYERGPR